MAADDDTYWTIRRLRDHRKLIRDMESDKRRDGREKLGECHICFYLDARVVGRAFTSFACDLCGTESMHEDTGTPRLCDRCAKQHGLCRRCKGNLSEIAKAVEGANAK